MCQPDESPANTSCMPLWLSTRKDERAGCVHSQSSEHLLAGLRKSYQPGREKQEASADQDSSSNWRLTWAGRGRARKKQHGRHSMPAGVIR
jgi:hypothetical protein